MLIRGLGGTYGEMNAIRNMVNIIWVEDDIPFFESSIQAV